MPRKRNISHNKTKKRSAHNNNGQRQTKQKQHDSDDELLDRLVAENQQQTGSMAPYLVGLKEGSGSNGACTEDEARRLHEVHALQLMAEEHLKALKQNQDPWLIHQFNKHYEMAKEQLVNAVFVLADENVPFASEDDIFMGEALKPLVDKCAASSNKRILQAAETVLTSLATAIEPGRLYDQSFRVAVTESLLSISPLNTGALKNVPLMLPELESLKVFEKVVEVSQDQKQLEDFERKVAHLKQSLYFMREQMGESELTCPICLGDCIKPRRPKECPHIACEVCLKKHLEANKFCPICRATASRAIVVNQDTLKNYYLDRLERNINDGVAWYHLSQFGIRSTDKNTKAYEAAITVELVGDYPAVTSTVGLSCAVLMMRNCSPNIAQNQWMILAHEFCFALFHNPPSPTRRELVCDLGKEYGSANALQAATRALLEGTPKTTAGTSSFYNPWVTVLLLMCRDYTEEIANGTFSVSVRGKPYSALELTEAVLAPKGQNCLANCAGCVNPHAVHLAQLNAVGNKEVHFDRIPSIGEVCEAAKKLDATEAEYLIQQDEEPKCTQQQQEQPASATQEQIAETTRQRRRVA